MIIQIELNDDQYNETYTFPIETKLPTSYIEKKVNVYIEKHRNEYNLDDITAYIYNIAGVRDVDYNTLSINYQLWITNWNSTLLNDIIRV